jgi:large subunit ribosomal protein L19e
MSLKTKKELASRTLNVGKNRISFNQNNLNEINEAITKQDIRDLYDQGIISIKPINGRAAIVARKRKRGPGKIKMKINDRKERYVIITRKLRKYAKELKKQGKLNKEDYSEIRKKIKMKEFKNKAHLKEFIEDKSKNKLKQITTKNEPKQEKKTKK